MEDPSERHVQVWRPWLVARGFYLLVALAMLVVVVVCVPVIVYGCSDTQCVEDGGRGWSIAAALNALGFGSLFLSSVWFRLTVTSDRLISRGPWWRTQSVPLRDVTGVSPGHFGMQVTHTGSGHRSGKPLTVWAVQTGNVNQWLGRGGRADRVGREVMAAAEAARPNDPG